ncbi:MAG: SET domain-containing protein-lysine N-methyltransferase [Gemmatimonadota bacterium]|nr:SET domain-containing protein-lysine N-methyltransferase [Gemmatimonadota bacterium]
MTQATLARGNSLAVVRNADFKGARVMTTLAVSAGELLAQVSGYREVNAATRFSVQVGVDRHIEGLDDLAYLNHSCAPNVFFNTMQLTVTALRDITAGEELSFFYPSTEWQMAEPFQCLCLSPECVGVIGGAVALSDEQLSRYEMNAHIRTLRQAQFI